MPRSRPPRTKVSIGFAKGLEEKEDPNLLGKDFAVSATNLVKDKIGRFAKSQLGEVQKAGPGVYVRAIASRGPGNLGVVTPELGTDTIAPFSVQTADYAFNQVIDRFPEVSGTSYVDITPPSTVSSASAVFGGALGVTSCDSCVSTDGLWTCEAINVSGLLYYCLLRADGTVVVPFTPITFNVTDIYGALKVSAVTVAGNGASFLFTACSMVQGDTLYAATLNPATNAWINAGFTLFSDNTSPWLTTGYDARPVDDDNAHFVLVFPAHNSGTPLIVVAQYSTGLGLAGATDFTDATWNTAHNDHINSVACRASIADGSCYFAYSFGQSGTPGNMGHVGVQAVRAAAVKYPPNGTTTATSTDLTGGSAVMVTGPINAIDIAEIPQGPGQGDQMVVWSPGWSSNGIFGNAPEYTFLGSGPINGTAKYIADQGAPVTAIWSCEWFISAGAATVRPNNPRWTCNATLASRIGIVTPTASGASAEMFMMYCAAYLPSYNQGEVNYSNNQGSFYLFAIDTAGDFVTPNAQVQNSDGVPTVVTSGPGVGPNVPMRWVATLSARQALNEVPVTTFVLPHLQLINAVSQTPPYVSGAYQVLLPINKSELVAAARLFNIAIQSGQTVQSCELGGLTHFASGLPIQTDGQNLFEYAFPYAPENLAISIAVTDITLQNVTPGIKLTAIIALSWNYIATYERWDASGNRHRSPRSVPQNVQVPLYQYYSSNLNNSSDVYFVISPIGFFGIPIAAGSGPPVGAGSFGAQLSYPGIPTTNNSSFNGADGYMVPELAVLYVTGFSPPSVAFTPDMVGSLITITAVNVNGWWDLPTPGALKGTYPVDTNVGLLPGAYEVVGYIDATHLLISTGPSVKNGTQGSPAVNQYFGGYYTYDFTFTMAPLVSNRQVYLPTMGFSYSQHGAETAGNGNASSSDQQPCIIQLWRTLNGGSSFYSIASSQPTSGQPLQTSQINSISLGSASITDNSFDGAPANPVYSLPAVLGIQQNELLYGDGLASSDAGAILDNETPPSLSGLITHKNRLWGFEGPNVWYSKEFTAGEGPAFNDEQAFSVDDGSSNVTAIVSQDERLVIFKQDRLFYVTGDGPDDQGGSNDLQPPQRITSDTGAQSWLTTVAAPMGTLFNSPNGLYLLDRKLSVSAFGKSIENLTITGPMLVLPSPGQILMVAQPTFQTPDQISAGLVLWLDPAKGITFGGGQSVAEWADQSGNGNNLSQSNPSNQPALIFTGGPNNKPYVTFSPRGQDYLSIAAALAQPNSMTVGIVLNFPATFSTQAQSAILIGDPVSGANGFFVGLAAAGRGNRRDINLNGVNAILDNGSVYVENTWEEWIASSSAVPVQTMTVNGQAHVMNQQDGTGFRTGIAPSANTSLNSSLQFQSAIDIAEVVVYNVPLGLAATQALHDYFAAKFQITPPTLITYDYVLDCWTTSALAENVITLAQTGGTTPIIGDAIGNVSLLNSYTSNGGFRSFSWQSAWIKGRDFQGFANFWRVYLSWISDGGSNVTVSIAYNYNPATTTSYTVTAAEQPVAGTVFQWEFEPYTRAEAIQITISDGQVIGDGGSLQGSGIGPILLSLEVEYAVQDHAMRLPSSQRN